ncbi:MAG: DUF1080 domain-containing protein [Cyclobacteriaceae bacterium]
MKKNILIIIGVMVATMALHAQKRVPEATELYVEIPRVTPGEKGAAPSDAVVLFDGSNTDAWVKAGTSDPIGWDVKDGALIVKGKAGSIETKKEFGDVQLHIEWKTPVMEGKSGQGYANSGVFFMGKYEVQVLNSYDSETYNNGQAGSIYKQFVPLVNATKPPGEWQAYDIIFTAPRFSDKGTLISQARLTVIHNGVLVQNNVALLGPTEYIGTPLYKQHPAKLPFSLQDHGDPVEFRNIWIREL